MENVKSGSNRTLVLIIVMFTLLVTGAVAIMGSSLDVANSNNEKISQMKFTADYVLGETPPVPKSKAWWTSTMVTDGFVRSLAEYIKNTRPVYQKTDSSELEEIIRNALINDYYIVSPLAVAKKRHHGF